MVCKKQEDGRITKTTLLFSACLRPNASFYFQGMVLRDIQHVLGLIRTGQNPKTKCCRSRCLLKASLKDIERILNDVEYIRSLGRQCYTAFIKTCILFSNRQLDDDENPTNMFMFPTCHSNFCRHSFIFLLGLSQASFYRIAADCRKIVVYVVKNMDCQEKHIKNRTSITKVCIVQLLVQ